MTVLTEIRRRLPGEPTVYLGDNGRTPYGPRPAQEVRTFTLECVEWLLGADVKLLVLACNTATAQALDAVRALSTVPVIGVVRPGAVAAAAATRVGTVGVVATVGTVSSGAYPAAIREADPRVTVAQQACPELVPLVEAGVVDGLPAERAVRGYIDQLREAAPEIDTLLLGCTHYPLLRPVIERAVGPAVSVVDSAFTTALAVEDLLDALGSRVAPRANGENRILTTGDVEAFRDVAVRIFGRDLPGIESIRLPLAARSEAEVPRLP